jgi:hypothetical protein
MSMTLEQSELYRQTFAGMDQEEILEQIYTRARPLHGWIGGGYSRRASGFQTGALYPTKEAAEREPNPGSLYMVCRLAEVMFGDTEKIRLAEFDALWIEFGIPRAEIEAVQDAATRRGWTQ